MIYEQYITFETLQLLKDKNIDISDCEKHKDNENDKLYYITQDVILRLFRQKYNIVVIIIPSERILAETGEIKYIAEIFNLDTIEKHICTNIFDVYEDAVENVIQYITTNIL